MQGWQAQQGLGMGSRKTQFGKPAVTDGPPEHRQIGIYLAQADRQAPCAGCVTIK